MPCEFFKAAGLGFTEPALAAQAGQLQQGAVAGGGIEYPSHAVRLHLSHAARRNRSATALFTDLKATFYSILPEIAVGATMSPSERGHLLRGAGLSQKAIDHTDALVERAPEQLEQCGVAPEGWKLAADWHLHSWLQVPDGRDKVRIFLSTRPGCPLADAAFALAFLAFQRSLQEFLRNAGLLISVGTRGRGIYVGAQPDDQPQQLEIPSHTHLDDFTILLEDACPAVLLANLALVAEATRSIAGDYGLTINFAEGKTEVVVRLVGRGAQEARTSLAEGDKAGVQLLQLGGQRHLRIVKAYRHLGVLTAAGSGFDR